MAKPQEKADALLVEINRYVSDVEVDEERLSAIQDEIAAIERAGHLFYAKQLFGMIASLRGDPDETIRNFDIAKRASGGLPIVTANFSQALANLQLLKLAVGEILSTIEKTPDDLDFLKQALTTCANSFHIEAALAIKRQLDSLEATYEKSETLEQELELKKNLLIRANTTWEQVCDRIALAAAVVRSSNVRYMRVVECICADCVLYEFQLTCDVGIACQVESQIHDRIASTPFSTADSFIAFSCLPT